MFVMRIAGETLFDVQLWYNRSTLVTLYHTAVHLLWDNMKEVNSNRKTLITF